MTNGFEKESLFVLIIPLYWKKRFSRQHTINPNANVWARPDVTFIIYDISNLYVWSC